MNPYEKSFSRVKQLCYSGLPLDDLKLAIIGELQGCLHFSGYCFNQYDPATELMVGSHRQGVGGANEHRFFLEQVYFEDYFPAFRRLSQSRAPVEMLSRSTGGKLEKAYRYAAFLRNLNLGDEMRSVLQSGRRTWGSLVLLRSRADGYYGQDDFTLLSRLAPHIGAGMQAAVLRSLSGAAEPPERGAPGVLILGPANEVEYFTPEAEAWLREMGGLPQHWTRVDLLPVAVLHAVSALKHALAMQTEAEASLVPQVSVQGRSGTWVTVQASRMASPAGETGRTLVLLEPSRPRDIGKIQTAAFNLTPQEEAVVKLVFQGKSTQEIAQALFISAYTVQDHLSHIFDKVGVRSRKDLVNQIYLRNQLPLAN